MIFALVIDCLYAHIFGVFHPNRLSVSRYCSISCEYQTVIAILGCHSPLIGFLAVHTLEVRLACPPTYEHLEYFTTPPKIVGHVFR